MDGRDQQNYYEVNKVHSKSEKRSLDFLILGDLRRKNRHGRNRRLLNFHRVQNLIK